MRRAASSPRARVDWGAIDAMAIERLVSDSRQVEPGDTFVAYRGETRDGREYIGKAVAGGAASVLWEAGAYAWNKRWRVRNLAVPELRRRAGEIASHVYGRPSARLWMVGVTGTNGKTSCSHWIAESLTRLKRKCAVVGTIGSGWPGRLEPGINTTPDAVWLQTRLRDFVSAGAKAASMEVSSHGLVQHRVSGVEFDAALFTNLTRDHLDYHRTMRGYRAAKAQLFRVPSLKWAVLNLDDAFGAELAARTQRRGGVQVLGYGFNPVSRTGAAGVRVPRVIGRRLRVGRDGVDFEVSTPWGAGSVRSALLGRFNAANLLGTLATLLASDVKLADALAALEKLGPVPGRTERYGGGRRPVVMVDYAHTPDALEKVLLALREILEDPQARTSRRAGSAARPRLICLFGCGGERDTGKRPLMGAIATRLADHTIITSDNPRGENPHAIIADILEGASGTFSVVPDRSQAIYEAIAMARAGDAVLLAGKGHERYQEIAGVRQPHSDADVACAALQGGSR
jgi:UDP-N-acetylmuramoyl-L-alanyl-D-glutamate--2,6-diaminopimelate ligase